MLAIPDSFELSDQARSVSGRELDAEVEALAGGLVSAGLRPGDRALVLGRKSVELAAALLAVPRAGGVVVAPHAGLTPPQLRHIVADASPSLAIRLGSAAPDAEAELGRVGAVVGYDELRGRGGGQLPDRSPHDPALIVYTSGSTGRPKGVVFSRENVRLGAESVALYYGLTPADRVLCLLPFSFDAGLNQLMCALAAGCAAHLRDFVLPQHAAAACAEHRITTLTGVPSLWRKLTGVDWPEEARASMRRWANTGGHMPVELSERICELFPNAQPVLMYGFTEAFRATFLPPELYPEKPTSVGFPIPHAAVALLREDGSLCEAGETGELVQFGPLVTLGYWDREEETRRKFAPVGAATRAALLDPSNTLFPVPESYLDRVAWSGDELSIDADGCLHFRSRRTALIKSQGFRVSPTEVEEGCLATGLVREAVAFGVDVEGEEAIAVVAVPASPDAEPRALRKALRATLPSYQVPHVVRFRESLPMTANGKYDLPALRDELAGEVLAGA